jgi:hypothetical protein
MVGVYVSHRPGVGWPITRSPSWPLSTLHDSTSILKPNL